MDTPGIGDIDQKEVATRMMDYIPNAVAFVFVINVAAAGGIRKDRVITIWCLTLLSINIFFLIVWSTMKERQDTWRHIVLVTKYIRL